MDIHLISGRPLDEVAIDALREFAPRDKPLWVGYSGGKDSCVILDLVRRSGLPFEAHYSFVPLDPPELRRFIREQVQNPANHLTIDYPARRFIDVAREKGMLPRRGKKGGRWCCELFKETRSPDDGVTVLGLRWEESRNREKRGLFEQRRSGKGRIINPIIGWSNADVWQYIRERCLPYCGLYDEGMKRIGCVLCPLARNERPAYQAKARAEMARWPGITRLWQRACEAVWQTGQERVGVEHRADFASPEALWEWWVRSAPVGERDDGECGLFGPPVEVAEE
jgi:phosphoadenosine phosphosulfate reductase